MAIIPDQYRDQLRAAGLLVSEPFVPNHAAFPDGVIVAKPAAVPGNSFGEPDGVWGEDESPLDAPAVWFHFDGSQWVVTLHEYIPGPGPGDFVNRWDTPEKAIGDILDLYFGNPARMAVKRDAREREQLQRSARASKQL